MLTKLNQYRRLVRLATAFDADDGGDGDEETITFELPENLSELSDEDLERLAEEANTAFEAIYDPDGELSSEDIETMERLAEATEAIRAEQTTREEQAETNREAADRLAARIRGEDGEDGGEEGGDGDGGEEGGEGGSTSESENEEEEESVTAGGDRNGPLRVSVSNVRGRARRRREPEAGRPVIMASADLGGQLNAGDEVTIDQVADQLLRRTQGMTDSSYRQAYDSGRRIQNAIGLLSIVKGFPEELVASADNGQEVLDRAVDQSRLPGNSLLAAGGWCAPSETVYDMFELETADGLVSVPEFQVIRGGIRWTVGPDFASLFAQPSFSFTEAQDEAGEYDNGAVGDKPCFKVDCPDFTEARLQVDGLCITAGILQNRAYPEVTARTLRGALVAHQHRLATKTIDALVAGSTAVPLAAGQVGTTAPVLTAIELQAQHYRNVHRMSDNAVLEAIFPRWVRGAIRSDLSRRLGVELMDVPDARITGWFRERGVNAQFVYNYQDLTGTADTQLSWPTEVEFLMYAAGTWARGSSDVISMDAIFDSALLKQNDFTALFTEEGWLMAKRGHDSRTVTVPITADGATHGGVLIDHDGTETA